MNGRHRSRAHLARVRRSSWAVRGVRRVSGVVGLLTTLILVACAPASGAVSETPLSGPHVFGWGFRYPEAVASDGTNVWVANADQSVTGFPAS